VDIASGIGVIILQEIFFSINDIAVQAVRQLHRYGYLSALHPVLGNCGHAAVQAAGSPACPFSASSPQELWQAVLFP